VESGQERPRPEPTSPPGLRLLTLWMGLGGVWAVFAALMSVLAFSAAVGFPESRTGNDELWLFGALTLLQLILGIFWLETAWGLWRLHPNAYGHAIWGIFLSAVLGTLWLFLLRGIGRPSLPQYLFVIAQAAVGLIYLFRPDIQSRFRAVSGPIEESTP
jgi:hypothetical protein